MGKFRFSPYIAAKPAKPANVGVNSGSPVKSGLLNLAKLEDEKPGNEKTLATLANFSRGLAEQDTSKINYLSNISRFSSILPLKLEKLTKCLHGLPCTFISLKDDRQVCKKNGEPIFDMDSCPIGNWFKYVEGVNHDRA